jgi:hypothetical protein
VSSTGRNGRDRRMARNRARWRCCHSASVAVLPSRLRGLLDSSKGRIHQIDVCGTPHRLPYSLNSDYSGSYSFTSPIRTTWELLPSGRSLRPHKPNSESPEARVAQTAVFAVCGFHSGLTDKPRTSETEVRATLLA